MNEAPRKRTRILQRYRRGSIPAIEESPLFLLRIFALMVLAVVVQTTFVPYVTVLGAKADLVLTVVVAVAMLRGPVWGAVIGFSVGLLLDIALVQTMGISSFLYTLAGYFSGRYAEGTDPDSWLPPLITVFIATIVTQLLNAVIMFLLGVEASMQFVMVRVVLPSAVLNTLLAAPIFVVCRWWMGGERPQSVFSTK